MARSFSDYRPRPPRHARSAEGEFHCQLWRTAVVGPALDAQLMDVSRQGFCVQVAEALEAGETVGVRIFQQSDKPLAELTGTVRWCQPVDNGFWLAGAVVGRQLTWETLGELFLHQVLSVDAPSGDSASLGAPLDLPAADFPNADGCPV